MPTVRETRAPAINRSSTERPKLSVPSQAWADGGECGGRFASAGSRSSGLTSRGEATASAMKKTKIASPVIPRGLARNVAQWPASVLRRRDHGLTFFVGRTTSRVVHQASLIRGSRYPYVTSATRFATITAALATRNTPWITG